VPLWAIAGTTMGLAISGDDPNVGGTGIAYGTASIPDPQRGVLGIEFWRGSTLVGRVPAKLVTRVMPDPASPAGLTGALSAPFANNKVLHQVLALIDIPASYQEGYYTLKVRRFRDATLTLPLVDEGPWDSAFWSQTLYISAGDGASYATPFHGAWGASGITPPFVITAAMLREIVPDPQLLLALPSSTSAATLQIRFPDAKVEIRGAIAYRTVGQKSLVTLEPVDADTVRIHYVSPAADAVELALVFRNIQTGYQPVLPSEFVYEGGSFYDVDGAPIAPGGGFNPIGAIR
jgi:hypothetical protein